MAGSQLKRLKLALKEKGLIGQTNSASKKAKKSKTSRRNEVDRDERQANLSDIRSQFNTFDSKINRTKHDITITQGGEFVTVGSKQHNAYTAKNGAMQRQMKMQYDLEKKKRNKTGGVLDRRFGENDSHLSQEEKMLARFTRERQAALGKKRGLYSLESDDDNDEGEDNGQDSGFQLTHSGQALSLDDDSDNIVRYVDEDQAIEEPKRKKSKNEVMKEIIAKSKYYKQQRQQNLAKTHEQIDELNEDFDSIMDDLRESQPKKSQFSTKTPENIEYDSKVRELVYDRRAVPADRTKTEEELLKEHEEKKKKLEQDRLKRMEGFVTDRDAEGDDLDDVEKVFWGSGDSEDEGEGEGEGEDEGEGFTIEEDGAKKELEEGGKVDTEGQARPGSKKTPPMIMPTSSEEFIGHMSTLPFEQQLTYIKGICDTYKPNLAIGNKEKMNQFVSILFEYVLHLSNQFQPFQPILKILKKLSLSYNEQLVETMRQYISEIELRTKSDLDALRPSDLVFFLIVAYLFSTSDHYHLIVTPCLILMNQILSHIMYNSDIRLEDLAKGVFLVDVLLTYQRFSKRFDPEVVNYIEFSMVNLIPEPELFNFEDSLSLQKSTGKLNIAKSHKYQVGEGEGEDHQISLSEIFNNCDSLQLKSKLIVKLVTIIDKCISLWRDKSSSIELLESFIQLLKHFSRYTSLTSPFLVKSSKLLKAALDSRRPLELQHHRSLGIATYAPKFEENFNPDKKSYDTNIERQQLAKVKSQLKKEQKAALKDIRYENRFLAREQIEEKKSMYDEYHRKMAKIVNSIQSEEGAERNQYEREKKQRKNKK
ncbi:NOP14 [Candida oxycetoniae]|uniref:NOP14 n=1 Tax=Candida oxycetoniae TaxID=497107 RepID=A0AAI9SWA4_9ASCO|nr:NOP14 [Candida oxycetoniae]KAI3404286.2 NOP14 [Candida oxycetoniae]